jgi:hypothetical protein
MNSNYSSLIIPPKYNETNVSQNIAAIEQHRKLLETPMGRVYVHDTGSMCNDIKSGLSVPRHTIINVNKSKGGKGILDSADADFESAKMNPYIETDRKFADKCMAVDINVVDTKGVKTVEKQKFISLAEFERTPQDRFVGKPIIPKEFEGFSSPDRVTSDNFMKHMDAGQRFFMGTVAVMGLYMFHQLLYGKTK